MKPFWHPTGVGQAWQPFDSRIRGLDILLSLYIVVHRACFMVISLFMEAQFSLKIVVYWLTFDLRGRRRQYQL